ncbi:MAG: uroporphyrinogen decarboxylase family protein [bacterium]
MEFSPSVYEHCARLIDHTPWEVSRDADLLYAGQAAAFRLYRHQPVVVGVDIYNLEAEAYGAVVENPEGNGIPAISQHPCVDIVDLARLKPFDPEQAGRIPIVLSVAQRLRVAFPDADVRVPVAGPFSIASNLVGFNTLLCAVLDDPPATAQALSGLVAGQLAFCKTIQRCGLNIAFFESAAAPPLLSPEQFSAVEAPALRALLVGAAKVLGHPVPCVVGGDTLPILEQILATGTNYVVCPFETDQPAFMKAMGHYPEVMVRINMSPSIVSGGTVPQIQAEVDRVRRLAAGRHHVSLGTGALPYETPSGNVRQIAEYVRCNIVS